MDQGSPLVRALASLAAWAIGGVLLALYARWKKRSPLWWGAVGALAWLPSLIALLVVRRGPMPTPSPTMRNHVLGALALAVVALALLTPVWSAHVTDVILERASAGSGSELENMVAYQYTNLERIELEAANFVERYWIFVRGILAGLAALMLHSRRADSPTAQTSSGGGERSMEEGPG